MSETLGLALGCMMAMVLFLYTFWPENSFASQRQKTRLDYLEERKEQLYENLRDLNFEYKAGKVPDFDYASLKTSLQDEAATILAEIARQDGTPVTAIRKNKFRKESRP